MSKVVLLVEDDEDNRDLVSFVIARSRMDVSLVIAENGQEAIDKAFANPPHLILMDMQMPVMDGWHAVPLLKADERTKDIPVIAFTAQAKPEDKQRAREMGCSDYYTKPMDPEELLALIKKYL
ncbi:MAG: two-component system response regulator [Bacteroidetes bacterium]|nr:two-component system response regulator [Bacteroidota bacterium]